MTKVIFKCLIIFFLISSNIAFALDDINTGTPPADTVNNPPDKTSQTKNSTNNKSPTIQNPLRVDSIEEVILLVVDLAIYVGVAFAVLVLIFIGFKFVLAQGNPDKLKEAKMWFLWTVVGLAILISSKVIVEIVKNTLIEAGVTKQEYFNKKSGL